MSENRLSEAQKRAQRVYGKKTKQIQLKYVLKDMRDYNRLQSYLIRTGQSANSFVKGLIKDFLDREQVGKSQIEELMERIGVKNTEYIPIVDEEDIKKLEKKYDRNIIKQMIEEFSEILEGAFENIREENTDNFIEWLDELEDALEDEENKMISKEEIIKQWIRDMYTYMYYK